jgi:predicted DNA-binding protein YlxM (UPF0122 family)
MKRITQCEEASDFRLLDKELRREHIREMYLSRLTMSQISRLTGVSKSTIHDLVKKIEPQLLSERERLQLREDSGSGYWAESEEPW